MKKVLLTLALALTAGFSHAQRVVDWSVEEIVAPTSLTSTASATSFVYDVVLKNNGTDQVLIGDTLGFQISAYQPNVPTNVYFALPNGAVYIRPMTKDVAAGDTIHLTGAFSIGLRPNLSMNITFRVFSQLINRTSTGLIPETSYTNNSKTKDMVWYCPQGWGVSVSEVYNNNLSVSPNPATDIINVSVNLVDPSKASELTVTDMTGRVVYSETIFGSTTTISTSSLEAGMYIINVKNGDLTSTSKVTVK
ncbi:MAG: T9SS type A sorting domain-containing protein [Chitinophagaceae bacterium]